LAFYRLKAESREAMQRTRGYFLRSTGLINSTIATL